MPEDPAHGDCSNGTDDNCDGFTDECDLGCNGCPDDAFSPNSQPFFVPMVAAGTYALQICPCRDDWFAFTVMQGQPVHVKATFDNTKMDLNLFLKTVQNAEMGSVMNVAASNGLTSTEEINWPATADGTYYLQVHARTGNNAPYTFTVF